MLSSRCAPTLLFCAAAVLSCKKLEPPPFTPGELTVNPEAFADVGPDEAGTILAEMAPGFVMLRESLADEVSMLLGDAALSLSPDGELLVNVRFTGSKFRSACHFCFGAPIRHATWKVSPHDPFVLRLDRGQYEVVEGCGSPFDGRDALILVFDSRHSGAAFMSLMAALETPRPPSEAAPPSTSVYPVADESESEPEPEPETGEW